MAWSRLRDAGLHGKISVRFLADEYVVDPLGQSVLSASSNAPSGECLLLLILHYLARKAKGLPVPSGEWLSLERLSVAGGFARAFKKPVTDLIAGRYGDRPEALYLLADRVPARKLDAADAAVALDAFEGVPVRVEVWRADDEFGPGANVLFDSSVTEIFCTEDIIVLAQEVARAI